MKVSQPSLVQMDVPQAGLPEIILSNIVLLLFICLLDRLHSFDTSFSERGTTLFPRARTSF